MVTPISIIDKNSIQQKRQNQEKSKTKINKDGILVDNFVKEDNKINDLEYSEVAMPKPYVRPEIKNSFNAAKAIAPLAIGTVAVFAGVLSLSAILLKSSKALKKSKPFENLPDLATNMNITQEQYFVTYKALRDPSTKNIFGAVGVFIYGGLSLAFKNFVDGVKEVWIKKRQADIERDLQENLIQVETDSFAGKIGVLNDMLAQNSNYMNSKIKFASKDENPQSEKGKANKKDNKKLFLISAGVILSGLLAGKITASNIRKSLKNANDFTNSYTQKAMDAIETIIKGEKPDTKKLESLFMVINAKSEYIEKIMKKAKFEQSEISRMVEVVFKKQKTLYTNAPTALGGIPEKIQYYCYLDEDRGHLYNWLLHPENKFAKYIFLSFATVTAVGYTFKQILDAIKEVTVSKQNANTDLNLKRRLVQVEVENFKSKKHAAVAPLMENFDKQFNKKKPKDELKTLADNILSEIKTGPPYIFG